MFTPLIRKGQSIHHIYSSNQEKIKCSEKTLYNLIDACKLEVRNIDLPMKVTCRQRKKKSEPKVDREFRKGRDQDAFKSFLTQQEDFSLVQMDTVIGRVGGKCLLTIHFVDYSFMLAFLRDSNNSQSVVDIFNRLDSILGPENFEKMFRVISTDNGSEFSNPKGIEYREYSEESPKLRRANVFYCDPYSSYQKGAIENNHKLIRNVLPRGTSFDHLTQEEVNTMMNHINSYKRKKLNNHTPYDTFSYYHGEEVLKLLECKPVSPDDILLKPTLLKK